MTSTVSIHTVIYQREEAYLLYDANWDNLKMFELKKAVDKIAGGNAIGGTHSPGLMPGMGSPGMTGMQPSPARAGTNENPVGAPPSIISAQQGFGQPGTLPTPDASLISRAPGNGMHCTSCGGELRENAKFCTKCGNKV